jgi:hypothetical protein
MNTSRVILSLPAGLLAFALTSCAPKKADKVSTDMVNISATASGNAPTGREPEIRFERDVHDFKVISQGERVTTAFRFKNVGGSPLLIEEASGSCGCTVPEYPKEPIPPGGEGVINVEFNSEGKSGQQEKTVRLTTNCKEATKVLTIKANVVIPKERGGDGKVHDEHDGHDHGSHGSHDGHNH